jgi:hypothetical protein
MNMMFQNIILFFRDPKTLFGKLRETPDLKRSFIIFALIICFYFVGSTRIAHVEISFTSPEFIPLLVSLAVLSGTLFLSVIYESLYFFLFCRFLGRKIYFGAILSSVIYCSIPLIFLVLLRALFPINLTLYSLVSRKELHPFLSVLYQRVGVFDVWISVMEILAIKIISGLNYKKSAIIVFSSWLITIMLTYFLGITL